MSAVLVEDGPDKGAVWHFGEPVKEQRALEAGTAWADLSHLSVIAISGEDRLKWLHDLTTQYLTDFAAGTWTSAMILDPQGHVEYQFNLVDDGTATYLVLDSQFVEGLITYLNKMRFMLRVEVRDATEDFAVMRAPGVANEIGGPFALVPRAEVEQMKPQNLPLPIAENSRFGFHPLSLYGTAAPLRHNRDMVRLVTNDHSGR